MGDFGICLWRLPNVFLVIRMVVVYIRALVFGSGLSRAPSGVGVVSLES